MPQTLFGDVLNILLIEDDEVKRQSVLNAIRRERPSSTITSTHSVRRAIDALSSEQFDLIVADMSLPTYDIEVRERGGTPRPFGGIEVFEHLERVANLAPVLVVTSYPVLSDGKKSLSVHDLEEQLRRDFPDNFAGIIYFNTAYARWERDIEQFFKNVLKR